MKKTLIIIVITVTSIAFTQSVIILDGDTPPDTLIKINDEGDGGGSITFPKLLNSISDHADKLYNEGGNLYWSGNQLAGATWSGWLDGGTTVRLRTPGDNVAIGITTTTDKLHVEGDINTSSSYKIDGDVFLTNGGQTETTLVGVGAGVSNTFNGTTAFGHGALYTNVGGERNTAVGNSSLYNNISGNDNTAVGYYALTANIASNNTGVGMFALRFNTIGENNTAFGSRALSSHVDGSNNTAVGSNTIGGQHSSNNTAIGESALYSTDDGSNNVAIGYWAGHNNVDGNNNTMIGYGTGAFDTSGDYHGNVFIGFEAGANTAPASNLLKIDNSRTANPLIWGDFNGNTVKINGNLEYTGTITDVSDATLKTNIKPLENVLKNIKNIKGVKFDWTESAKNNMVLDEDRQLGIIAQDVEEVYPEIVKTNSNGYKTVDYTKLSAILLEAVKEQQKQIEELQSKADAINMQLQFVNTK